jgi:hypothetical protein
MTGVAILVALGDASGFKRSQADRARGRSTSLTAMMAAATAVGLRPCGLPAISTRAFELQMQCEGLARVSRVHRACCMR